MSHDAYARKTFEVAQSNSSKALGHLVAPEFFLTTPECAAILRLSPRTLERMRVQGAGPRYVKAGPGLRSKVLYQLADILAWTDAQRYSATSEYVAR